MSCNADLRSAFVIDTGACELHDGCIASPGWPSNYPSNQNCTISVLVRAVLDVSSFNISASLVLNDNSCPYAGDNVCDDSNGYRRSACEHTHGDARDAEGKACLFYETPNDDSCPAAGDNTCDEGTNWCDLGTDCTDCGNCGGFSRCGGFDDDDFTSSSMCCACGGGAHRCIPGTDCTDCGNCGSLRLLGDILSIGSLPFADSSGPDGVVVSAGDVIQWDTDGSEASTGWLICAACFAPRGHGGEAMP